MRIVRPEEAIFQKMTAGGLGNPHFGGTYRNTAMPSNRRSPMGTPKHRMRRMLPATVRLAFVGGGK
jgi:hypothetical protein